MSSKSKQREERKKANMKTKNHHPKQEGEGEKVVQESHFQCQLCITSCLKTSENEIQTCNMNAHSNEAAIINPSSKAGGADENIPHGPVCRECVDNYVTHTISNAYVGSCPVISCPCVHSDRKKRIIPYETWSAIVSKDVLATHTKLVGSVLAFLCGGCHNLRSIGVVSSEEQIATAKKTIQTILTSTPEDTAQPSTEKGDDSITTAAAAAAAAESDAASAAAATATDVPATASTLPANAEVDTSSASSSATDDTAYQNQRNGYEQFEAELNSYVVGTTSVDEFYQILCERFFPSMRIDEDKKVWDAFIHVLRLVVDPERRAALQLRHLRARPRMWTPCCNREHCFRCRTKDFHNGKTCAENTGNLDSSIVECPSCDLPLTKGDGCNTVTCVCGKQFSWSSELENYTRANQFKEKHPDNTAIECAKALISTDSTDLALAKSWQTRHRVDVDRALMKWWIDSYSLCPSQCCSMISLTNASEGIRQAAALWKSTHSNEVENCTRLNSLAKESLFLSMFPSESERAAYALALIGGAHIRPRANNLMTKNKDLIASARMWVEKNQREVAKEIDRLEKRSAEQFLVLYGNRLFKCTSPSVSAFAFSTEWSRQRSNNALTFSNENTSVRRDGSVSCYPAAFADLPSERSMITVEIDACVRGPNWLTFGIAKVGMAEASSDGVGITRNTWGISDDRGTSSSVHARVVSSGSDVCTCRKFRQGDRLQATIDTVEGWCEVSINGDEFMHRFEIPTGTADDYCFAMTFANDHAVTIITDGGNQTAGAPDELNYDHNEMYLNLKRRLKKICSNSGHINHRAAVALANKWSRSHGGDDDEAAAAIRSLLPLVDSIVGGKSKARDAKTKTQPKGNDNDKSAVANAETKIKADADADGKVNDVPDVTWNSLVQAICWYHVNNERIEKMKQAEEERLLPELARNFLATHGDAASFIAAIQLAEAGTSEEDKKCALAYMKVFPTQMQEWYDYNASLSDPLIKLRNRTCRCLPRHQSSCPPTPTPTPTPSSENSETKERESSEVNMSKRKMKKLIWLQRQQREKEEAEQFAALNDLNDVNDLIA